MRSGMASIEELLGHGGWLIDDAQARRSANPDTFWMPENRDLASLHRGTLARLIFQLLDQADPVVDGLEPYDQSGAPNLVVAHERMWVWVEEGDPSDPEAELVGILTNLPMATHTRLVPGARVSFKLKDVIDLDLHPPTVMDDELEAMTSVGFPVLDLEHAIRPEDAIRDPAISPTQLDACAKLGVRPQRPLLVPFVQCLVSRNVTNDARPLYGARWPPNPERSDCGWIFWAGDPDIEVVDQAEGFDIVAVTQIKQRSDLAWKYLALPPGWAFVVGADNTEDAYQDPELLA